MTTAAKTTETLQAVYKDHVQQVTELQHLAQQQYPPSHPAHDTVSDFLNDRITLFRFLKKANYSLREAHSLVLDTLAWRNDMGCDRITPRDIAHTPLWSDGLVVLRGQDRYRHPILTIRLSRYSPAPAAADDDDEEADRFLDYKRYIVFVLECTRKLLWESSRRSPPEDHALQATLILDLDGASVSDLDHQLISYTIDLLKHRYPSCIAQVYVLNYSWVFGGIWQMLKRALPETARARVSFPNSADELQEHIDLEELSVDLGGLDTYQYDPDTCESFHYFGYPSFGLQANTPTVLSRVNSCDSIYFDAISTPLHSPGLRPHGHAHDGLSFLSMTPMMPMAPPSRPASLRSRSNSIPFIDLNHSDSKDSPSSATSSPSPTHLSPQSAVPVHGQTRQATGHPSSRHASVKPMLKSSKSSAHIPSFMITPSIQTDLPTQYPLSRKDRQTIGRTSIPLVDPKQPRRNGKNVNGIRGGLFYRLILRPNSIFMRLAATQQGARQKIVKVVKTCADKAMRTDIKTLMYWVMALIMLRGEVWHLIAATAVKVLTIVGEGDDHLLL